MVGLARQKHADFKGVTVTWLHEKIRDEEIFLPEYTLFHQEAILIKGEGRYPLC